MKRLFAAFHLTQSDGFSSALEGLQADLSFCRIAWSKPSQLHLTLKFFGETPESALPAITETMAAFASSVAPFTIHSESLGIFGSSYNPRVIWVSFRESAGLGTIGDAFLDAMALARFPRDRQNFVPHLTLGRIKEIPHRESFQMVIARYRTSFSQEFPLNEIILFESILSPKGPTYIPLYRTPLCYDSPGNP